jgi:hypothetical protein
MSQKILNIKIKALRATTVLLFTLAILITLLISPISEWLISFREDAIISFNAAVLFMWLIICLILSFGSKIYDVSVLMMLFAADLR